MTISSIPDGGGRRRLALHCRLLLVLLLPVLSLAVAHSSLAEEPRRDIGRRRTGTALRGAAASSSSSSAAIAERTARSEQEETTTTVEDRPPRDFLRWRRTTDEEAAEGEDDSTPTLTLESKTSVSNDFDDASGTYVAFDSVSLRLGPIVWTPPEMNNHNSSNDLYGNYYRYMERETELVRHALESHLNDTLNREAALCNFSILGRFGFARVDEVEFVELIVGSHDRGGDSGRNLAEAEAGAAVGNVTADGGAQSPSSIVLSVTGRAFYLYGLGGVFTSFVPTEADLNAIVTDSVQRRRSADDDDPAGDNYYDGDDDDDGRGYVGDVLASEIRRWSSAGEFVGVDMFDNVESASVLIETTTTIAPSRRPAAATALPTKPAFADRPPIPPVLEPWTSSPVSPQTATMATDSPTPDLVESPSDVQDGDSATVIDAVDAPPDADSPENIAEAIGDDQDNDESSEAEGDMMPEPGTSSTDDAEETEDDDDNDAGGNSDGGGDANNDQGADASGLMKISEATANDSAKSDDGGDNGNTVIIVVAVACTLLALVAAALMFVGRKRYRRAKADERDMAREMDVAKAVPMCQLTDDDDYFECVRNSDSYSEAGSDGAGYADQEAGEEAIAASPEMTTAGRKMITASPPEMMTASPETMTASPERSCGRDYSNVGTVASSGGALQIVAPSPGPSPDSESQDDGDTDFAYDKMLANAVALQIVAPSPDHPRDMESQDDGHDTDLAYDKMLANAVASGGEGAARAGDGEANRGNDCDDSVLPQIQPKEQDTSFDDENTAADDEGNGAADEARCRPLSLPECYALERCGNIPVAAEQSLASESTLGGGGISRDIADLDVLVRDMGKKTSSLSDLETVTFDVFGDTDEATKHAAAGADVFGDETTPSTAQENNCRALDFVRESLVEQFASPSTRDIFDDDGDLDDVNASHEILMDINQAAEVKRSMEHSGSTSGSWEKKGAIEFAAPSSNVTPNDNAVVATERNHIDLLETSSAALEEEEEEKVVITHGILDAINEAAKNRPPTIPRKESHIPPAEEKSSNECNVVSPLSSQGLCPPSISLLDPPEDIVSLLDPPEDDAESESNDAVANILAEWRAVKANAVAGLTTTAPADAEDDWSSSCDAALAGCGNALVKQTKENYASRTFACKRGSNEDDVAGTEEASFGIVRQSSYDPDGHLVSDLENDDSDYDERNVSRPWREKWDDGVFANCGGAVMGNKVRTVSPIASESSNYDPDSDWDVDDCEVEDWASL